MSCTTSPKRSFDPQRTSRRLLLGWGSALLTGLLLSERVEAEVLGELPRVGPSAPSRFLVSGYNRLAWDLPANTIASLGVFGPPESLLGMRLLRAGGDVGESLQNSPLEEDGLLPRVITLRSGAEPAHVEAWIDTRDAVEVRSSYVADVPHAAPSPKGLASGEEEPRPLVGLPNPHHSKDGYGLQVAGRYAFLRIDVVQSLLSAFAQLSKKFAVDPVFVGDASQWNGKRPKTDLNLPRHISHDGGVDVDIGLPASDTFPSTLRDHCRGVRLEPDRFGCSPGTAKGLDVERLAFLLGKLIDESSAGIVKVYIDDVYRREVIRVVPSLFERRLLKENALAALSEDGILVASPWHTDHVHVRFGGEKARALLVG